MTAAVVSPSTSIWMSLGGLATVIIAAFSPFLADPSSKAVNKHLEYLRISKGNIRPFTSKHTYFHSPLSFSFTSVIFSPHSLFSSSPWYTILPSSYGMPGFIVKVSSVGERKVQNNISDGVVHVRIASSPSLTSTLSKPSTATSHCAEK